MVIPSGYVSFERFHYFINILFRTTFLILCDIIYKEPHAFNAAILNTHFFNTNRSFNGTNDAFFVPFNIFRAALLRFVLLATKEHA